VVESRVAVLGHYDDVRKVTDSDGITRAILARRM
jgi:hypothetical protein